MNFKLIALLLPSFFTSISLAVWTNISSHAQLFQPGARQDLLPLPTIVSPDKRVLPNAHLSKNTHTVNMIYPTKHQQVPIGVNLIITGTSLDNATSHCQISVIVNGVKPYHTATATGPGGAADYSKWNFVLSSNYTTLEQGPDNKITAKYSCSNNPAIAYFRSVNVTGVATSAATATKQQQPSAITGNSAAAAG